MERAAACAATAAQLQSRLQRAVDLQRNLTARTTLLAELRMLAPARTSAAERHAREVQLPALEDQTAQLKAEVSDLARRALKLVRRAPVASPLQRIAPPAVSQISEGVTTPRCVAWSVEFECMM